MAKIPGDIFNPHRGAGLKGINYVYQRAGSTFVAKWPKPFGPARSPAQAKARQDFATAMLVIKNTDPSAQAFAAEVAKGAPLLPRDLMMAQLFQRAFYFVLSDGRKVFSMTAMQDVSLLLDTLEQTPGGILVRRGTFWEGLVPALPGQVVVADADLNPQWGNAAAGGAIIPLDGGDASGLALLELDFNPYIGIYPILQVELIDFQPSSNSRTLQAAIGTGNPPNWHIGGGDYSVAGTTAWSSGGGGSGGAVIPIMQFNGGIGQGNQTFSTFNMSMKCSNWSNALSATSWRYNYDFTRDNSDEAQSDGAFRLNFSGQGTGLQFSYDTGVIAQGSWRLQGIA